MRLFLFLSLLATAVFAQGFGGYSSSLPTCDSGSSIPVFGSNGWSCADSISVTSVRAGAGRTYGLSPSEYDAGNSGTSKTIDWSSGTIQKLTLTGNLGTLTLSNPVTGAVYVLRLVQDGTGSRTVTWPAAIKWPSATAPTLSTTAARTDVITLYYDGTYYYGSSQLNY